MARAFPRSLSVLAVALLGGGCAHQGPSVPPSAPSMVATPVPSPGDSIDAPLFSEMELRRIDATQRQVVRAAHTHGISSDLINAIIWVESRFDPGARSPAGARGLMQLMPATARALAQEMGVRPRAFDPEFNVSAGTFFLSKLLQRYEGNEFLALAAYHSGPGTVDGWRLTGNAPDYSRRYVQKVQEARLRFVRLAQLRSVNSRPALAARRQRSTPPMLPPTPGQRMTLADAPPQDLQPRTVTQPMEPRGPGLDPAARPAPPPQTEAPPPTRGLPTTALPEKTPRGIPSAPPRTDLETPSPQPEPDFELPSHLDSDDTADPEDANEDAEPEVGIGILPSLSDDL